MNFFVIQILREINFGGFRNSKNVSFLISGAQKMQQLIKSQTSEALNVLKWHFLDF